MKNLSISVSYTHHNDEKIISIDLEHHRELRQQIAALQRKIVEDFYTSTREPYLSLKPVNFTIKGEF